MPKAVENLLKAVLGILFAPGLIAIMAFPVALAIMSPTQPTADFLGLILAVSGALLVARGLYSWLHIRPRTIQALLHPSSTCWVGLLMLVWGCVLCIFSWPQVLLEMLSFFASLVAGGFLVLGWAIPVKRMIDKDERAQQAQAAAQEHRSVRRHTPPLFAAWVLCSNVIGYALFFLTLNGQLSAFLTSHLSYEPPFGPLPLWLSGICTGLAWGYIFIIRVPASLRMRPRRQRFLFLLARKIFGVAALGYGILISLELTHALSERETDLSLELLATLAGMAGLTYLAAWAFIWLIRRREARQHQV
jgi:hypothetical protein